MAAAAAVAAAVRRPVLYNWPRSLRRNVDWVLDVTGASFASLLAATARVDGNDVNSDDGIIARSATRTAMVAGRAATQLIIMVSYG